MRILHVHTRYRQPGGEDSVVDAERSLLRAAGHEVVELDFENPISPLSSVGSLLRAPWNPSAARRIRDAARGSGADVAHVHNTWFAASPAVFAALADAGVPSVATFHNYRLVCANAMLFRDGRPCEMCVGRNPWAGVHHACYRSSRASSAVVAATIELHRRRDTWRRDLTMALVLTEFSRSVLLEGGLPPDRTRVIPNFVSDPGPRPAPPSASDEVLFVGRLSSEKGLRILMEAWQAASPSNVRLTVIGDGPEAPALRSMAPSSVTFTGRLPPAEVAQRMLRARALLFPSIWYEGQPMVIVEALAAGLPVAVSNLGALPETVGGGGLACEPGDSVALAGVLSTLADGSVVDSLSLAGRTRYELRHTPEVGIRLRLEAYREAIDWVERPT